MASSLYESYTKITFPKYDSRKGSGYGGIGTHGKSKPSVGTALQKQSLYPYVSPEESDFSDVEDEPAPTDAEINVRQKVLNKTGGASYINGPFASNWVDRGAFVNWASRLDLYEGKYLSIKDIDFNIDPPYSLGGPSQIISMGNGAGIYKTKSGKTIGMSPAGRPQSVAAKKTQKKIPPSLKSFIAMYLSQDEEEV